MRPEEENIVEKSDYNVVAEAEFTLDGLNYIITGDERFYRMIGEFSFFSFDKIVHDDDRANFLEFVKHDNEEKDIFIRCKIRDRGFRLLHLIKLETRRVGDDTLSCFRLQDVILVCQKYRKYFDIVKKYRSFMDILPNKFFDLNLKTGIFTLYYYNNHKAWPIVRTHFDEWKKYVVEKKQIDEKSMKNFNMLCECIENEMENFSITLNCSILTNGVRMEHLSIKGQTLKESVEEPLVLGVITQERANNNNSFIISQTDNPEAGRDSGTGLLNKKTVTDKIIEKLSQLKEEKIGQGRNVYLLVLDIDNFKQVNDNYGHYFGDEVIKYFAKRLSYMAEGKGLVGRIGGDEFIVYLDNVKDEEELRIMLKSMRLRLKLELKEKNPDYLFSTSIGISRYGVDGTDFETLFKISDACLYIAKDKGKDRFIIYDLAKHGNLLKNDTIKVARGNDFLKPIDKYELATKLVMKACKEGTSCMVDIIKELGDKLNLHGIRVFVGDDLKRAYSSGHYIKDLDEASYINSPEYSVHFDEHDMYVVNNVTAIYMIHPELASKFKDDNICSFIQARVRDDKGKFVAMMQFDIFGENRRKWSNADICTLRMLVLGLTNIAGEYDCKK